MSKTIYVYADWLEQGPILVGTLTADLVRGNEHFSFQYSEDWLQDTVNAQPIDPELQLFAGAQHAQSNANFRVFLDSCPDRWGRVLMTRREALLARNEGRPVRRLQDSDYLLGVTDQTRMGALRFKTDPNGPFLDNDERLSAPPITSLRQLEHAASVVETDPELDDPEYQHWLEMLITPGSSLGGARPKASVVDEAGNLFIAKFPSRHDDHDIGAWEYLTYKLALKAGINMAESRIMQCQSEHHIFLTKRFDRYGDRRIHFSSAMTQLGYEDGVAGASYLELAEFLMTQGSSSREDLAELWRRIVFSIAVSNVDDHLRNHGFIFDGTGWRLAPAYDINPTVAATGLNLNIDDTDNRLDYDLALSVSEYFLLSVDEANDIITEVLASVMTWRDEADRIGISRAEQLRMESAFFTDIG